MRTFTSSANNQHPSPKPNMFPQLRTLHHHPTINNQHPDKTCPLGCALHHYHPTINTHHPSKTCSLGCALYHHPTVNTQQPITKHVPSDAHFTSSPNSQHPTAKPNMFPRMRTLHHHPIIITHHPTAKHVPSDAHFIIITQQSTPITQQP